MGLIEGKWGKNAEDNDNRDRASDSKQGTRIILLLLLFSVFLFFFKGTNEKLCKLRSVIEHTSHRNKLQHTLFHS